MLMYPCMNILFQTLGCVQICTNTRLMISFCYFTSGLDIWPPCITVWLPYHQNHVTEGSFGFIISRILGLHRRRTAEFKNVSKSQNRRKCVWSGFLCVAISPKKEKKVVLLKRIILVCQEQVYLPGEESQFCWYSWRQRETVCWHRYAHVTCTCTYSCIHMHIFIYMHVFMYFVYIHSSPMYIYTCTDMYTSF